MTDTDLDALEQAARECDPPNIGTGRDWSRYYLLAQPDVILRLIAADRAAELARDQQERFKWAANDRNAAAAPASADLDALERAALAATPGPWRQRTYTAGLRPAIEAVDDTLIADTAMRPHLDGLGMANAAYIAAASPDVILRLIAVYTAAVRDAHALRKATAAYLTAIEKVPWNGGQEPYELREAMRAALSATEPATGERCQRCGRSNAIWHAPSPLWNAVMRDSDGRDHYEVVCPVCFAELAEASAVAGPIWHFTAEPLPDLPQVGRDGRVWDATQCLWVEPAAGEREPSDD